MTPVSQILSGHDLTDSTKELLQACQSMVQSAERDLTLARQAMIMTQDTNEAVNIRVRLEMIARYHGTWKRHVERVRSLAEAAGISLPEQEPLIE